ncbi:MAG: fatty acid desaturase family protein [Actinomycetota bacterium]|nr:fatty acid desaturase family protein [Actinomycetota bacterium]
MEAVASDRRQAQPGQVRGLTHVAEDLTDVSARLTAFNLTYFLSAWVLALGAIALYWAHPAWFTFAAAFLIVSSRQQALLNCEHECVHRKFVRSRRANDVLGVWLLAAPVGSPFRAAQARHLAHHRLLGLPEDPDRALHTSEPPRDTPGGLLGYFVRGLLGAYAVMILFERDEEPAAPRGGIRALMPIATVQVLIAVGLSLAFAWWVYPALWLAPLASLTTLSHLVRSYSEHAITPGEEHRHANRLITVRSNLFERSVVAPYWMNLHAEHHLLPSVPAPRLRQLRARLAAEPELPPVLERSSYFAALRQLFTSLRQSG